MTVRSKTCTRFDTVFVQNAEASKALVVDIMVTTSRQGDSVRLACMCVRKGLLRTYEAKEKVWKVFSQSWSALPRSVLQRGMNLTDIALIGAAASREREARLDLMLHC